MDLLSYEEIASVTLFNLKLSEGELMVYEGCIDYVINNCTNSQIKTLTGCENREELKNFQSSLQNLIKSHTDKAYWLDSLKMRLE